MKRELHSLWINYLTAKIMSLIPWDSGILQIHHMFPHISQIAIVASWRKLVECLKIVKAVTWVFTSLRNNVVDSARDPNIKNTLGFVYCCSGWLLSPCNLPPPV